MRRHRPACRRIVDATVSGVRFSHSGTARTSYPEFNDLVYRNRSHSESVSSRSSSDMYAEGRLKLRPKTPNTDSVFFFEMDRYDFVACVHPECCGIFRNGHRHKCLDRFHARALIDGLSERAPARFADFVSHAYGVHTRADAMRMRERLQCQRISPAYVEAAFPDAAEELGLRRASEAITDELAAAVDGAVDLHGIAQALVMERTKSPTGVVTLKSLLRLDSLLHAKDGIAGACRHVPDFQGFLECCCDMPRDDILAWMSHFNKRVREPDDHHNCSKQVRQTLA